MNRINECIEQMQEFIKEIEERAAEHCQQLADNEKLQVEAIAAKTIDTINNSIEKLEEMKTQVSDDSQLVDFLQRLNKKCEDVKNFTIIKIEEIKPVIQEEVTDLKEDLEKTFEDFKVDNKEEIQEIKENIQDKVEDVKENLTKQSTEVVEDLQKAKDQVVDTVAETIEKILKNENVKNVVKFIIDTKDKAVEIYNMPETQKAINDAKLKVIELAEKGLDSLKAALETEHKNNDENI